MVSKDGERGGHVYYTGIQRETLRKTMKPLG